MNDSEFYFSPKGHRKLSKFVTQGLMFDYLEDNLDLERRHAFEQAMKDYPELQEQMNRMKSGFGMCENLEKIKISTELSKNLSLTTQYFGSIQEKLNLENLPPALKLGIEGLFIALTVATMAIVIPWNSLLDLNVGPRQVILSEVLKNTNTDSASEVPAKQGAAYEFPDDSGVQKSSPLADVTSPSPTIAKTPTPETAQNLPQAIPKVDASGAVAASASNSMKGSGSEPSVIGSKTVTVAGKIPQTETESTKAPSQGESFSANRAGVLYRGTLYVTNFRAVTPKLVEKLQELGGRKAGQVELGWFKGESSYFHFTMPESRYNDLATFFNTYGNLVIQKEPHERVMPDGIRRIIITVYEKK